MSKSLCLFRFRYYYFIFNHVWHSILDFFLIKKEHCYIKALYIPTYLYIHKFHKNKRTHPTHSYKYLCTFFTKFYLPVSQPKKMVQFSFIFTHHYINEQLDSTDNSFWSNYLMQIIRQFIRKRYCVCCVSVFL